MRSLQCLTCLLLHSATAYANDSAMGGSGANLMPMKSSDVRMASEDITLTFAPSGLWEIDARYEFANSADKALTLQLGFPEYRCDPHGDGDCVDPDAYRFQHMQTFVRGRSVPHRKGKVSRKHAWSEQLGATWLFDVSFAARERVPVRHVYQVPGATVIDGTEEIFYVTRTGSLWAGPIGVARFHVRLPLATTWFAGPDDIPRQGFEIVQVGNIKYAQISYELRDWTPDRDLDFAFREGSRAWLMEQEADERTDPAPDGPARSGLAAERCQNFTALLHLGYLASGPGAKPPTDDELQAVATKGINTRRICRNAVFAMYGQRFQDERLNRYFYGPAGFVPDPWPAAVFRPNPYFDKRSLKPEDWKAIEVMDRLREAGPRRAQGTSAKQ